MRLLISLSLIFGVLSNVVQAQTVTGPNSPATNEIRSLMINVLKPVSALQPPEEKARLAATEIRLVPGGPFPGPRAGIDSGQRVIIIPEIFFWQIMGYVEAEVYGEVSGQPHFAEWWVNYALWRSLTFVTPSSGPFYQGEAPHMPLDFAGLSNIQKQQFRARNNELISALINAVFIDILLHELGHHAIDQWYVPGQTPPAQARAIEASADAWASEAFEELSSNYPDLGIIDTRNVTGRFYALGFMFELERWRASAQIEPNQTHPTNTSRISAALMSDQCDSHTGPLFEMCTWVQEKTNGLDSHADLEADYRLRASQGEGFAHLKLGLIEFQNGDFSEGCDHMMEAVGRTDRRANQYAGWCVEFGHSAQGMNSQDARDFAVELYRPSADAGWVDSKWGLIRLGATP